MSATSSAFAGRRDWTSTATSEPSAGPLGIKPRYTGPTALWLGTRMHGKPRSTTRSYGSLLETTRPSWTLTCGTHSDTPSTKWTRSLSVRSPAALERIRSKASRNSLITVRRYRSPKVARISCGVSRHAPGASWCEGDDGSRIHTRMPSTCGCGRAVVHYRDVHTGVRRLVQPARGVDPGSEPH